LRIVRLHACQRANKVGATLGQFSQTRLQTRSQGRFRAPFAQMSHHLRTLLEQRACMAFD
jgi:hypothetical protein